MAEQFIFMDGEFVTKANAKVSVFDHGFLYGDGIFEGIRIYDGNIFRLDEHLKRLFYSAKAICLEIPYNPDQLTEIIIETVNKNELRNGYIRLVISRGIGDLGIDPASCKVPSVIIIAEQLALFPRKLYEEGIEIVTVSTRRNRGDVLNPKIKSLNYLNNILVKLEAKLAGVHEALMLNDQGYVAEGSADNVFILYGTTLITPPSSAGALEGITRNAVMELGSQLGYKVEERLFTTYDVYNADEVFLTGTAAEVIAVTKVDGRVIGTGKPGKHTEEILNAFRELVVKDGKKIYAQIN